MTNAIYIGWDPREDAAFGVAQHSLLRHLSQPIPVHRLVLGDLQARGLYTRPTERKDGRLIDVLSKRDDYDGSCSTEHSICRFLVPHLAQTGWAAFMDSDMLVRADFAPAFNGLDPSKAVYCVQHDYAPTSSVKMDAQVQTIYPRKNQSSMMIFNCDHEANKELTPALVNTLPGRELHRFCWLDDCEIGALGLEWNWLVRHSPLIDNVKVAHFTEGCPDMAGYESDAFADEWRDTLEDWATSGSLSLPG